MRDNDRPIKISIVSCNLTTFGGGNHSLQGRKIGANKIDKWARVKKTKAWLQPAVF